MNFGYLIIVSKNDTVDYLKLAYSLAMSIKITQPEIFNSIALVIDTKNRLKKIKSSWVFDHVIEWDQESHWDGRAWMDKLSPFDSTVCLDADMLFTRDISHWIDYFNNNCDLYIANKSFTYKGEIVTSDFYRKAFTANKFPNLYSFFTFFKKESERAKQFFKLSRYITRYPDEFLNNFSRNFKPKIVGTDEAFAMSADILDIADDIAYNLEFPRIVHMKPMVQNWPWQADKCSDHVSLYFNKQNQIKIGNYFQSDIIHYVEKDLITDEIISIQEEKLWNM